MCWGPALLWGSWGKDAWEIHAEWPHPLILLNLPWKYNYFFFHIKWPAASDPRAGEKVVSLIQNEEKPICLAGCEWSEPLKWVGIERQAAAPFHKRPGRGEVTQWVQVSGCSPLLSAVAEPEPSSRLAEWGQLCTLTCCCHAQMLPNHETEFKKNHNVINRRKKKIQIFFLFPQPSRVSHSQGFLHIFFILKWNLTSSPDSRTYGFTEKSPVLWESW